MPVPDLPKNHEYFFYQDRVNHDLNTVASHNVVVQHQQKYNVDYRAESQINPVPELNDRTKDNVEIARSCQ
ncbi:hypothetical protein SDC9_197190 [bioreactor metagenome]|uniref:Uncharacterized protein n=1 Tax=bioreactor metagenome TaxID=1076179 RepID=A0A645IE24_9ZZZZ